MTATPPAAWRRSSECSNGTCVEVAMTSDAVLVRDSKDIEQTPLHFTHAEWANFLSGVHQGEFDL